MPEEAIHGEGFWEAHPHALVGLKIEACAALGQQIGDVNPAGVRQTTAGFHRERLNAAEDGLAEALAHDAAHQQPVAQLHVNIAAREGVGHIEAFRGEGAGVLVCGFLLQEEAGQFAAELEVAHHHGPQGYVLVEQRAGGTAALHRRNQADAIVIEQGD